MEEKEDGQDQSLGVLVAAVGVLLAVGLLMLILLAVEAGPAEATFSGKSGKIAYTGNDGQDYEIYTINVGGGGKFNVTDNGTGESDPSWGSS